MEKVFQVGLFEVYLQGILALHGCDILGFMDTHTINFLSLSNRICGHLAKDTLNFHWIFFFSHIDGLQMFLRQIFTVIMNLLLW